MTNKILLSSLAAGTLVLTATSVGADDWSYRIEPYLLGASIEGDAGIGRASGAQVDLDFGDILDALEMGFMGRFEAQNENGWGVALDYAFMDLGADITGSRGGVLDAEVHQGIFEALLMRRKQSGDAMVDYYAGLRWWNNEVDVVIDPAVLPGTASRSVDEDWIDLVVGARLTKPISEKWSVTLQGDVGGVGSDFTAAGVLGFRYKIGDSKELDLQYKALKVDYETGAPGQPGYFRYDTTTHGPVIGLIFKF